MDDPTVAPRPLRRALARSEAAPTALLAVGIPHCPACELLPTSLAAIRRARPGLTVEIALLESPADWAEREELLWARSIHVSRASVPMLVLFRDAQVVATRSGGGPAGTIDAWVAEFLGPPDGPISTAISDQEAVRLEELAGLRARHLAVRERQE